MGLFQERRIDPKYRGCYNATGGTILKGQIVKLVTPSPVHPGQVALAAAATDALYGVADNDIPNLQFGDVQISGVAIVLAGATIAAGVQVTSDGNGKAAAAASGNSLLGVSLTDGALNTLMEVELATPGGEAN